MNEILTPRQRSEAFYQLGNKLLNPDPELNYLISASSQFNAWFIPDFSNKALQSIAHMLMSDRMEEWILTGIPDDSSAFQAKKVGLILAGNIPLVGFHDILAVLASGHIALIKLSSQDTKLIPHILEYLCIIEPQFRDQIQYTEMLKEFDAVIATGSNNSSRYFEYYFSKVPHIIRKNRNSVAIIDGQENTDELHALGSDVFDYFGLGCRNVSKLFVPKDYDFKTFFESIESYSRINDHHKYNNNYDYNKSIFLVNLQKHFDNGFLLLKEDRNIASPLAVLFYEEYNDLEELGYRIESVKENIQCIVGSERLEGDYVNFGETQIPGLFDYADGVNTMEFLEKLGKDV